MKPRSLPQPALGMHTFVWFWALSLLAAVTLCSGLAAAEIPAEATAGAGALPAFKSYVQDQTATLTQAQTAMLEGRLQAYAAHRGTQLAVVLVASTYGEPIQQYALRLAEAWQLGRKGVDDGVLLLLAIQDQAVRIEVGYGLEGALPDGLTQRIIRETLLPQMRQGNYYAGIRRGLDQLMQALEAEALPPRAPSMPLPQDIGLFVPFVLILALAVDLALRSTLGWPIAVPFTSSLVGMLCWMVLGSVQLGLLWALAALVFSAMGGLLKPGGGAGGRKGPWLGGLGALPAQGLGADNGVPWGAAVGPSPASGDGQQNGGPGPADLGGGGSFGGGGASGEWRSASA